jgi:hypothetical protein
MAGAKSCSQTARRSTVEVIATTIKPYGGMKRCGSPGGSTGKALALGEIAAAGRHQVRGLIAKNANTGEKTQLTQ